MRLAATEIYLPRKHAKESALCSSFLCQVVANLICSNVHQCEHLSIPFSCLAKTSRNTRHKERKEMPISRETSPRTLVLGKHKEAPIDFGVATLTDLSPGIYPYASLRCTTTMEQRRRSLFGMVTSTRRAS